jgi:16S rRNA (uracil1498-N3)-methyltransferase
VRRYFYEGEIQIGSSLNLQGDLFHHIFDVCRLQQGQHFELLNNRGLAFLVKVETVGKKQAQVFVQEERVIPPIRTPHIHLYLSFPKVPTFEMIVEKSVELGVVSITPVLSDFSFVRTLNQFPTAKVPRWQKIILQATQQSGRGDLMRIEEPIFLNSSVKTLRAMEKTLNVVAYEGASPLSLKNYLASEKQKHQFDRVNLFVGSEGGFSDEEIVQFKNLDLPPVTLGDQVLRVETACLTLVASLKYEFDLLS